MEQLTCDAVVIGAGPNGLVAANALAEAGWDTVVLEAAPAVGGAVASAEVVPGYVHDLYSSFYPLAAGSGVVRRLGLEDHGLRWVHAPAVLAHVERPGAERAHVLHRDAEDTAKGLDAEHPGDGETWLRLVDQWQRLRDPLLDALFSPFPPVRAGARLAARLGPDELLRTLRQLLLPVHRLGEELFGGQGGRLLLAGNAMHSDAPAVAPTSGVFGWLLTMLGQDVGFPVPEGGAGRLAGALAARARAHGAQVRTGERVDRVLVAGGRAVGVRTAGGLAVRARRAVVADVDAPTLLGRLVGNDHLPPGLVRDLTRFERDSPTVKVNWALDGPVPWRAEGAAQAGTVHLGADAGELAMWSSSLAVGRPSEHTFVLVGQMATADPTRAPAGGEALWAYSHLPKGRPTAEAAHALAARMEDLLEAHAPGFRDVVRHRWVQTPGDLQEGDASLVDGSLNGGTAQLHQQLVLRPVPGLGRSETVVRHLYLASASAHPGGGVHGAAGWIAAQAALRSTGGGGLRDRLIVAAQRRVQRTPRHRLP
ncbi:MAG: NAD(P)/FAD-dependent oxidoreductase [Actinobacteria bacterium]|nr:NAD(P)/FAD-dependent oxidoreductase [Actinomycetota bacterium]